jgi:hypothetical protein
LLQLAVLTLSGYDAIESPKHSTCNAEQVEMKQGEQQQEK